MLTLAEYLLGTDLHIDQLLFKDVSPGATYPGRPSPHTSLAFVFAGISLLLLNGKRLWLVWTAQAFGLAVGFVALVATIGYVYKAVPFYGVTTYTGMALPTVFSFLSLSFGIVFAKSDRGLAAIFTGVRGGGMLARRLMPAVILIPLLFGGLRIWGESGGLFSTEFGLALEAVFYIMALGVPVSVFARVLERAEADRESASRLVKEYSVQLEAVNEEMRAFSYSVAHDLRAPLRSIDGFSLALAEDYADKLSGDALDYFNRIRESAQQMGNLIDDLLRLARITSHEMRPETVDLSAIVRQKANELRATEPTRQVEFVIGEGISVKGDSDLLLIALENLLTNAWKFTSKHPTARIEFGRIEKDGNQVYFVRDDGAGLDMRYAEKLFKPFSRLHTTSEFHGSGIGLTIVQRIIRRHGGHVWAEGEIEKGAAFYFTLGSIV
ncbi:MAG: hypothetical protein HYX81_05240 [Chloroflexi bacterium]|nr:hypothetical protein [Chloroflexota bacterium]